MIYLFLSILCSSAIFILFKGFEQYKVNTFTAIVINYLVAGITGIAILGEPIEIDVLFASSWSPNALFLGLVFISLFNIMAITAQKFGASVASIANKMALIIPVIYAIMCYGDSVTVLKVSGILLALLGVYFSTLKAKREEKKVNWKMFLIPLLLFLGSGFIDTFLKYNQEYHLEGKPLEAKLFSSLTFFTAASIGVLILVFNKSKRNFSRNTIIGGIVLGIINYGSIYFLIQIFDHSTLQSSVVFPINNMGVVILTALSSFFIFKEQFTALHKLGVIISLIAIVLISIS